MKALNLNFEDEVFKELESLCEELEVSKEEFAYEVLKRVIMKKYHKLDKKHDNEKLQKTLEQVDGEDEWM